MEGRTRVVLLSDIGEGWSPCIAQSFPEGLYCIQVHCVACCGEVYTTEARYGREKYYICQICSEIPLERLVYMMHARGIQPQAFARKN